MSEKHVNSCPDERGHVCVDLHGTEFKKSKLALQLCHLFSPLLHYTGRPICPEFDQFVNL